MHFSENQHLLGMWKTLKEQNSNQEYDEISKYYDL